MARVVESIAASVVVLLSVLVSGCGGPGISMKESGILPRPGALVELGEAKNASGHTFDVEVETMLRGAMRTALKDEQLEWTPGSKSPRFSLDLNIVEYRPGNAFQRWLAPGYGSTVLGVEGTLRETDTGALAATFRHERSVHFGGAYTIGAWATIFDQVAEDIARDLKVRIEQGGQFVVYLKPRADQSAVPQPAEEAVKIKIAAVKDERGEKGRIGTREAAFGVAMGDVHLGQNVTEAIRQALRDDLLASGHRIVESGEDLVAEGHLRAFWIHTDTTVLYWDVVANIELELVVSSAAPKTTPARKLFTCRQTERTYVWPSATVFGTVGDACVAELMLKVRTDDIWKQAGH